MPSIDGGPNIGTERYEIIARRSDSTVIETIVSPQGSGDGPASLDARPWTFTFDGIVGTNGVPCARRQSRPASEDHLEQAHE